MIRELDVLKTRQLITLEDLCRERRIDPSCHRFTVNQNVQGLGYTIAPGDEIHYEWVAVLEHKEEEAAPQQPEEEKEKSIKIRLNGEALSLQQKHDKSPYLFVDMLNYVDIDPSKPQGNIVLRINGRTASYVEEVRDGDEVEIYWDTIRTE